MLTLGTFTPSSFITPNNPIVIYNVDKYFEYIRFTNNSPSQLNINFGGLNVLLGEFRIKDIPVPDFFQQTLIITPSVNITSVGHGQSNQLTVEGFYLNEIDSPLDVTIPQQAVTTTATGKPIYSATVGFGSTVGLTQQLNIFNPPNSGVVATFHAARVFTNDATTPTAHLSTQAGADKNLALAVPAVSHTGTAVQPISVMHCTALDQTAGTGGVDPEVMNMQQNVTQDFLSFPDIVLLYPGNNLFSVLQAGATGKVVRLTIKWTEDIIVPPILVIGINALASSIKNDGNPPGTQLIESTVSGDGTSAVLLTNDAQFTLGDVLHNALLAIIGNETFSGNLTPSSGGKYNSQSGHTLQDWNMGFQAINTTATTVTHGLKANGVNATPTVAFCINGSGGAGGISYQVTSLNTTTFTVTPTPATATNVFWIAFLI